VSRSSPLAEATALLVGAALLWAAGQAHADGLGRLFSTPEERARLDRIREDPEFGKSPPVAEVVSEKPPEAGPPRVPEVTINGVVIRAGGRSTAWINGHEVAVGEVTPEGLEVRVGGRGERLQIRLPEGTSTVPLKPGQRIDVLSGVILEPYQLPGGEAAPPAFEPPAGGPGGSGPATPGAPLESGDRGG